jgi:hypothetical protein
MEYARLFARPPTARRVLLAAGAAFGVLLAAAGCPKPPPPKLPPSDVPRIGNVGDSSGERGDVVADAVQQGSNQARIQYDCATAPSQGVEGKAILNPDISKCELNRADGTLTISNQSYADCPLFLLTINGYHGPGTYNTSSLGHVSFGTAKLRQPACKWDGSLCLDWNGSSGPHPEASCTIEINSDGGLQYGTSGSTVSGTFVCADFNSPYKGCGGASARPSCIISRASFSIAGCVSAGGPAATAGPQGPTKGKGKRPR